MPLCLFLDFMGCLKSFTLVAFYGINEIGKSIVRCRLGLNLRVGLQNRSF